MTPIQDRLLAAIQGAGTRGMTLTELHAVFGRHRRAAELRSTIRQFIEAGQVVPVRTRSSGGRIPRRFRACERSHRHELLSQRPADPACAVYARAREGLVTR